jgi:hypothetical protein
MIEFLRYNCLAILPVRVCWISRSSVSKIERSRVSCWQSAWMTCLSFYKIVILSGKNPSSSRNTCCPYLLLQTSVRNGKLKYAANAAISSRWSTRHINQIPIIIHSFSGLLVYSQPVTVVARSKAWTVFASSDAGFMGSNPTQSMDVSVCMLEFCLLLSCV